MVESWIWIEKISLPEKIETQQKLGRKMKFDFVYFDGKIPGPFRNICT